MNHFYHLLEKLCPIRAIVKIHTSSFLSAITRPISKDAMNILIGSHQSDHIVRQKKEFCIQWNLSLGTPFHGPKFLLKYVFPCFIPQ